MTDSSNDPNEPERDWWGRPVKTGHGPGPDSHEAPEVLGSWPLQDALLVAGRLRQEGLEAMAESDYEVALPYGGFPKLVKVYVTPNQVRDARRIVEELRQA